VQWWGKSTLHGPLLLLHLMHRLLLLLLLLLGLVL
jgi:hypothetical protein